MVTLMANWRRPRLGVALRHWAARRESAREVNERVHPAAGGVAHAGGERVHRRGVGQIGAERGGRAILRR